MGLICFLPFPSWHSRVALVTSATVIMYAFAPITLLALRKADAPLAFITANEIIYWTSWSTVEKLMLAIAGDYVYSGSPTRWAVRSSDRLWTRDRWCGFFRGSPAWQ
ncbi:MAG: hypothetical protein LC749_10235 [Actinobacteria bacterium]|nr:hypothetical protein [Actinomycetota bacterium]